MTGRAGRAPAARAIAWLLAIASVAGCTDLGGDFASRSPSGPAGASAPTEPAVPSSSSSGPDSSAAASAQPAPSPPAGGTWARIDAVGPAPAAREDHTWTVDADGRTAYLFGGRDGGRVFDDLWAFDLESGTWREIDVAGRRPGGRFGHEAAWIPLEHGLVVTFGQRGSGFYGDIWQFNPGTSTWRELPADGSAPIPRYGSCSGVGPDGRLWISHGFTEDGSRFADTLSYDFPSHSWLTQSPLNATPVERCLHGCWWTSDGRFALYGGQTTGVPALGDLWFLTPGSSSRLNTWAEAPAQELPDRQLAAFARRGAATFLVGGRGTDREPLADAWILPDAATTFSRLLVVGDGPAARSGAAMVYDAAADRLLLFGGIGEDAFGDLWALRFEP